MPLIFWLDITALSMSAVLAASLALIALGSGPKRVLNCSFALFTLAEASWAVFSILLRLALWLNRGNPLILGELATLTMALMGPSLLIFGARFVGRRTRQTDQVAILGLAVIAALAIPLFRHQLVFDPHLDVNGSTSLELSNGGLVAALLPALYMVWSLLLFWKERHQTQEPYLTVSILTLLAGFTLGGVLNVRFPLLSVTNTASVAILGYGVISRQLFNPLKEQTIELQREVAERVRVENALRESRERYRGLVELAFYGVVIHSEGQIDFVNAAGAELLGAIDPAQLVGKPIADLVHPDYEEIVKDRIQQVREQGKGATPLEEKFIRLDGMVIDVEVMGVPIIYQDRPSVQMVFRDISERVQAEMELQRLKEFNEDIVQNIAEGIVVQDAQGYLTFVNPAAATLLGYAPEELSGQHWTIIVPPDQHTAVQQADKRRARGQTDRYELELVHKDGTRTPVLISGKPRFDAETGHFAGTLAVFSNITEGKRAERLLESLNRAALAMEKALTPQAIFVAVADELKKLGLLCAVFLLDESQDKLFTKYLSHESRLVKAAEKLAGLKAENFPMPVDAVAPYKRAIREKKSTFIENAENTARQLFPKPVKRFAGQIVRMLKVPKFITAPLIVEDEVIGLLSVQSKDLLKDDIAAITAFAHQMAAAWHKAQLFEQAQQEIAERVRTEKALRESEKKFRNIIESIPMGMHMYQLEGDGRLVFSGANPAADKILGVDNDQFVGKTIQDAFPALAETDAPESYRRVASTGEMWQTDQIIYDENQIAGAFEVHAFQTAPGRMVAAFLDITERVQAAHEIAHLQHLLQNIANSMPSALIALDLDGQVLLWNPAAETLTGQTASQAQGRSLWQTCPELSRYRDLFERVLREGQVTHWPKEPLATKDGLVYHDVSGFPLTANEIEGIVLRIDDVSWRVQLEELMFQSTKMASVGRLAAGVAHEINNPLGAMMQSAQMLQMIFDTNRSHTHERLQNCGVEPAALGRYLQERDVATYLDGIRAAGERAAKIISDLLSFSRKSSSKMAPHDLNALVIQTLDLAAADYDLKKSYDFRDIEIILELPPGLPPVACDGQQIQQVMLNLVRNAAQAMAREIERGDRAYEPRLTLCTMRRENMVRLTVEDNGPGIPKAVRTRLFEPFFTTKDVGEGTGLGLWLCWSIVVERHKGQIWVEPVLPHGDALQDETKGSEKESGSRFIIELPTARTRSEMR